MAVLYTGRTGTTVRDRQEPESIDSVVCAKPPAFRLPCLSVDLVCGCWVTGGYAAAPSDGKLGGTIPRSTIASHDWQIPHAASLT